MVFPGLGVRVRTFNREPAKKRLPQFNPSPEITHNFFSTFAPVPTAVTPHPWTQGIAPHLKSQTFFPTSFPARYPSTESTFRLPRPSWPTERPSLRPSSRPGPEEPRSISPVLSGQRGSGKVPTFTHLSKHQVGNYFEKLTSTSLKSRFCLSRKSLPITFPCAIACYIALSWAGLITRVRQMSIL